MTIEEIERGLPNGLHDAQITNLSIDYIGMTAEISLNVWIGDLSSRDWEVREKYRKALPSLTGLSYFAIDAPDPSYYSFTSKGAVTMDLVRNNTSSTLPTSKDDFVCEIFVSNWNSLMRFSASSAELVWIRD